MVMAASVRPTSSKPARGLGCSKPLTCSRREAHIPSGPEVLKPSPLRPDICTQSFPITTPQILLHTGPGPYMLPENCTT